MFIRFALKALLFITVCKPLSAQTLTWVAPLSSSNNCEVTALAVDTADNVYSTGRFSSATDLDPGSGVFMLTPTLYDFFLLKLDSGSNFNWAGNLNYVVSPPHFNQRRNYLVTGGHHKYATDFDFGSGSTVINSNQWDQAYIARYDLSGNLLWAKAFGDTVNTRNYATLTDSRDNIYAYGNFTGTFDIDPGWAQTIFTPLGPQDRYLCKFGPDGILKWAYQFEYADKSFDYKMKIKNDRIYTATQFYSYFDAKPQTAQYLVPGAFYNTSACIALSKLDTNGFLYFAKSIVSQTQNSKFNNLRITVDDEGSLFLSGDFKGTCDFDPDWNTHIFSSPTNYCGFILKLDSNFSYKWMRTFPNNTYSTISQCELDSNNVLHFAGYYTHTLNFGNYNFTGDSMGGILGRLDAAGEVSWAANLPAFNNGRIAINAIAFNGDNDLYVGGSQSNQYDADPDTTVSLQGIPGSIKDGFILKLKSVNTAPVPPDPNADSTLQFHIFPNPADDFFNMQQTNSLAPSLLTRVTIYDVTGRQVSFETWNTSGTFVKDIKELLPGVYEINIFYLGTEQHLRFIKK